MFWNKRIKDLRMDANMTIVELAKKLDISERTLSRYESGISEPTIGILIKMNLIFGVSIDYICAIKDSPEITETSTKEKLTDATSQLMKLIDQLK